MAGKALEKLRALRDDPYAWVRSWRERRGGKVVGFFCCYAPEEIIHAAGALPVRITGENRSIRESGAYLQSYCCSLARTGLDMALTGDLDFLDGTVFVHTCDTMMRLSDIWRLDAGFDFHGDVVLPVRFEGAAAEQYMTSELKAFAGRVAERIGPVEDGALRGSIELYNRNRELLRRLYELRRENPGAVSSADALWLVASSALVEKGEHNAMLEAVLSELGSAPSGGNDRVRLFVVGSVMDQWDFPRMVDDAGGAVVDDDLCTGRRYFDADVGLNGDPVEGIARRLMERASCPCKHMESRRRAASIAERVSRSGARGVIFFQFKFCEPHAFDYPHLKKVLDEEGIPSLLLEIEQGSVSTGQLRTRVEALLETIRG